MSEKICICSLSALELYRSMRRLLPELLAKPRTGKLDGCGVMPDVMLKDEVERLGVKTRPYHLLSGAGGTLRERSDVVLHRRRKCPLPYRALIVQSKDILVTGPEMTFIDLASNPSFDEVDLALIGFELCGTYLLDNSWDGLTNTEKPLTHVAQIERMMQGLKGAHGLKAARTALELVHDGSNSPMETVLCALLTFPRRLGGFGLGPVSLNYRVSTGTGFRLIDVAFPEHKVGLEYKGREFHSIERVGRDDRRQNEIVGSGWTILNVWYEDLVEDHLFERLMADLAHAMGIRLRSRSNKFEAMHKVLRVRLLPAVMKFG